MDRQAVLSKEQCGKSSHENPEGYQTDCQSCGSCSPPIYRNNWTPAHRGHGEGHHKEVGSGEYMSAEVVLPQENTEQEAVQGWMIYTYVPFTIKGELLRREGPEGSMFHRRILFDGGLFFF